MQSRTFKQGLITGDKDGKVQVWGFVENKATRDGFDIPGLGLLTKDKKFDLRTPELKSMMPSVKSVSEHPKTGAILVGTRGGEIVEFGQSKEEKKPKMHLKSHYHKEQKGLAPHPTNAEFLTVGQDGMLGVWDIRSRRQK